MLDAFHIPAILGFCLVYIVGILDYIVLPRASVGDLSNVSRMFFLDG